MSEGKTIKAVMDAVCDVAENDKTIIIFTLLVYGIVAMSLGLDGSVELVEKLSSGLLGMAIGRGLKK